MKDIMLKIIGKQVTIDAEEQQLEFVTEGKYYVKGDSVYLLYDESEFSGMEGCTTSLEITGDNIKMKRCGENVSLDTEITKDAITADIGGFSEEAQFLLRINDGTPGKATGCTVEHITGNIYSVTATSSQITIAIEH